MRYPAYAKYRDSGVEWLGEIPEGWEVRRLRFLTSESLKYGANESAELDDRELPRYIRITDVNEDGTLNEDTFRSIPYDIAKEYLLKSGDILLARSGATVGKSFQYFESWGVAAFAGYLIRFRVDTSIFNPRFSYYYFRTKGYWGWIDSTLIQATIQNVSAEKYANAFLPLPVIDEQKSIADFLDKKTSQIDALIEKKKELIEKLKEQRMALITKAVTKGLDDSVSMKDSGVDWLGEIPEGWEVMKIHHVVRMKSGETITSLDIDEKGEFPVYGGNGLRGFYDRYTHNGEFVLIGRQGALCGNINYANGKFWASEHAVVASPDRELVVKWLGEVLRVMNLNQYSVSAAQPGLSVEEVGRLKMPFPPLKEQLKIAEFIEYKTSQIDALIKKAEEVIERLKEYRMTLITGAVTGKIRV